MPRRWINKKSATTYQLLHREQADPRIHDESSPAMVLTEMGTRGTRQRTDLDAEFAGAVRANEGEAAEHGVFFDDSTYDYMQHLRDLGGGGSVWVEPEQTKRKDKGKEIDQALRDLDLEEQADRVQLPVTSYDHSTLNSNGGSSSASASTTGEIHAHSHKITDESILPSSHLRHMTYQDQQDVPDALAGFQPDMDIRLREVLEALNDDAYIDDEEEPDQLFSAIAADREEISLAEFEDIDIDEDDGWESDDTARPEKEYHDAAAATVPQSSSGLPSSGLSDPHDGDYGDGEFMANFRNLPKTARAPRPVGSALTGVSALTTDSRRKKRKGAKTSSNYSMTSSSLARTDALTTLDARFEKTLETYLEDAADDDNSSVVSGLSGISKTSKLSNVSGMSKQSIRSSASFAPSLVDDAKFNDVMDEFLGDHTQVGRRRVIKGKHKGIEQLDEIRKDLGPARIAKGWS